MLLLVSTAAVSGQTYHSYSLAIEPWGFQQTDTGISPRFIQFLAQKADIAVKAEVRPYLRVLEGIKSGTNAMTMWVPTPERDRFSIALCKPATIRIYVSYKKQNAEQVSELSWFQGKNVGELRGSHTFDRFDRSVPHNKVIINDMAQGFRMLQTGHLDGTICVRPGCRTAMAAAGVNSTEFDQLLYDAFPIAVYVSKNSSLSKDAVAMAKMRAACESKDGKQLIEKLIAPFD
jgi:polar amino acid transport system substrate-binding protein